MRLLSLLLLALTASAQTPGWIDLFPNASLSHWTRIAIPPTHPLGKQQWKVDSAHHILICEGDGGHEMLRYNREFKDIVFHVEWRFTKLPDENAHYNSGVFVRNNADGTIWHQAQSGAAKGGYIFGNTPVNGVNQRINLSKETLDSRIKPPGEWNTYDIRCEGRTITVSTNGGVTSVFKECEVPKGYIALEAEGYRIEFRNIRVKIL